MIHSHVKWSSHVKYLCLAAQNEMLTIEMKVQKLFLSSCHFDGLLSGLGCAFSILSYISLQILWPSLESIENFSLESDLWKSLTQWEPRQQLCD